MTNLKSLLGKLNDTTRRALEAAAGLCLSRTNYEVDVEHLLVKLLDQSNTDASRIFEHFGVNVSRLERELTASIDRFKTGNARTPAMSPRLPKLMADAWLIGSVDFGTPAVRSGHILLALLSNPELADLVRQGVRQISLVSPETLRERFDEVVASSGEQRAEATGAAAAAAGRGGAAPTAGTKALDQFTIDLTARAKEGKIDPITGRDFE